jgi:hypothetical protein
MDLTEIEWGDMEWIDLAQDREQWRVFLNTVMKLRVPLNVAKFLSSCTTSGFSRRAELRGVSELFNAADESAAAVLPARISTSVVFLLFQTLADTLHQIVSPPLSSVSSQFTLIILPTGASQSAV